MSIVPNLSVKPSIKTDGRMPVSMTSNGQKYYLHYDQVGSLRAVSDANGNVVKEITYDTFGNIINDSNPIFKVPFGFAGGLYDVDTKLTRFGYRDYDAYTGKWTAKDPIGFSGGDSNLYGYVLGDPVNFVDPSGEHWVLTTITIAGITYTIWKWITNIDDNQQERNRQEAVCDKIKNSLARALCRNKARNEHLDKERNNSCEVGKGLTPNIKNPGRY